VRPVHVPCLRVRLHPILHTTTQPACLPPSLPCLLLTFSQSCFTSPSVKGLHSKSFSIQASTVPTAASSDRKSIIIVWAEGRRGGRGGRGGGREEAKSNRQVGAPNGRSESAPRSPVCVVGGVVVGA